MFFMLLSHSEHFCFQKTLALFFLILRFESGLETWNFFIINFDLKIDFLRVFERDINQMIEEVKGQQLNFYLKNSSAGVRSHVEKMRRKKTSSVSIFSSTFQFITMGKIVKFKKSVKWKIIKSIFAVSYF